MLSGDNFYMISKFVEFYKIFNFGIHKKIDTRKHLPTASICDAKIERFFWKEHFMT